MAMLGLKIITIALAALALALFIAALFLLRNALRRADDNDESPAEAASEAEIMHKIEEAYVLIPRAEAVLLIRAITQANAAGYKVTSRLDKADLRIPSSRLPDPIGALEKTTPAFGEFALQEAYNA
jgi:hypothetical protein